MKSLVKTDSPSTREPITPIDLKLNPTENGQSEEERKLLTVIIQRYDRMRSARTIIDRWWYMAQLQFEAQFIPYADGRARSNVPLEWAITELFVAEAVNRESKPIIQAIGESDISKAEVMKRVLDYIEMQSAIKEQLYKNEYITALFGTGFYLTAFTKNTRVINDVDFDDNGDEVYKKKLLEKNRIIIKALDPRNVYLDDRTTDFNDDNDQILIDYITPEQLQSYKYDKNYKNIDKVGLGGGKNDLVFFTNEELGKMNDQVVEIMHYWNKQADKYVVIANRNTIIRDTPLPYSHKELPIVPRQYGYNPLQKYGRGLCEALVNFKSNINILNEMIMDGIRRSNNSMFVVSNWLTFDGDSFGFNNTIVKSEGPVDDSSFREIRGQQPNNAIFQYSNDILKQVAIYIGIDPAAIIGSASSTAFETAVKQETGLKRVNMALMNRDMALSKVYNRHVPNVMQFFPIKTAKGMLEVTDGGITGEKEYPTLMLKNENMVNGEFVEIEGNFPFEISPDVIRGQFDIRVETNFTAPTLKQLKIARYGEFADTIMKLAQIEMIPEFKDKIPMDQLIDEIAFDFDIDVKAIWGMEWSIAREKKKLMEQVQQMAWVAMGEQQPGMEAPQLPAPGQPPEEGVRKSIGGIMTPATPDIAGTAPQLKSMM